MADETDLPEESVLCRLEATGRPAPKLQLPGDDARSNPVATGGDPIPLRASARYSVIGEVARGGVGVVMRARDADLGRDVALKVLREDHTGSADLLRRFVEEAQVGGQLQHPGIVPVYELGLQPDGRPFFAMKLVKGGTLAKALTARKSPDEDRRRFLSVFEQVCLTMAYVHSRGVVHRDLKPANIMIGSFGEVQVVDWGFGKVLSHGGVADERRAKLEMRQAKGATVVQTVRSGSSGSDSLAGSVMGTPAYMPPEQALGQIERVDERSDVFALGAILCEILTGRPPYTGEDVLGQAQRCRLSDAHGRLAASGGADELVKLTMACLAPLPKDRPKGAGAVAAAVTGYLSHVDERAHRSRLGAMEAKAKADQARAAAQEARDDAAAGARARRQVIVGAGVVFAAIVSVGVAMSVIAAGRTARARAATAAADEAVQDSTRLIAARDWERALAAAERAAVLAKAEGAEPSLAGISASLVDQIRKAKAVADAEAAAHARDVALVAQIDGVRERLREDISPVRRDGEFTAAFRTYGLDVDKVDTATAADRIRARGESLALRVAGALDEWACLRRTDARLASPGPAGLVALAQALDSDPTRNRVREEAAKGPAARLEDLAAELDKPETPATTLVLLAHALICSGDRAVADPLLRSAFIAHPEDFWIEYGLAWTLAGLGDEGGRAAVRHATAARALDPDSIGPIATLARAMTAAGNPDEAIALVNETLPRARQDARLHAALSLALRVRGDFAGAMSAARTALECDPGETRRRVDFASALVAAGDPDGALTEAKGAAKAAPESPLAAECLATVLFGRGDVAESILAWKELVRMEPRSAVARTGLGLALAAKGDGEAAMKELTSAILRDRYAASAHAALAAIQRDGTRDYHAAVRSCQQAIRRGDDATRAWGQNELGEVALVQNQLDNAQNAFEAALALLPNDPRAHAGIGTVLYERGKYDRAVAEFRTTLALVEESERRKAPVTAVRSTLGMVPMEPRVRIRLGVALRAQQKLEEAVVELGRAVERDPKDWKARHELGVTLLAAGSTKEAVSSLREAVRLKADEAKPRHDLGRALLQLGLADDALDQFRKAVELDSWLTVARRCVGEMLMARGDFEGAAIEFDAWRAEEPDDPDCRRALARTLVGLGKIDAATNEFRGALRLDPDDPETLTLFLGQLVRSGAVEEALAVARETAKWNAKSPRIRACYGAALTERGLVDEALVELRAASEGGAMTAGAWPRAAEAAAWLARAERLATLLPRLDAVVHDPASVTAADERLGFAELAAQKGAFASAVPLYRAAFAAAPAVAADLTAGHRAAAARAAVQASFAVTAQKKAAGTAEAAALRKQAIEWLRTDLAARNAQIASADPQVAHEAFVALSFLRTDRRFAPVREGAAANGLPKDELDLWQQFWRDVAAAADAFESR